MLEFLGLSAPSNKNHFIILHFSEKVGPTVPMHLKLRTLPTKTLSKVQDEQKEEAHALYSSLLILMWIEAESLIFKATFDLAFSYCSKFMGLLAF